MAEYNQAQLVLMPADLVEVIAQVDGLVRPGEIVRRELARRTDGIFVAYDVAEGDPRFDLRYVCLPSSGYPRLWQRTTARVRVGGGSRAWTSLDREFAHDAALLSKLGADEVAVKVRVERVRFTSRTGPRRGEQVDLLRPRLVLAS
ncbi:hypothetical protein GRS96_12235 [Rathayibacter sp. VKM Ac-2803]|uniref:hypothetical protein n=1 Tax=Rathayibacter sp. VKM Ac-2803 TaxID=2609256 RepID=UPI0013586DCE|nr:hypothetical protein [Rathayibacter sp. VKM Ac-2803]MWV50038.1 hypothetical protein [Rathayibacter sp. VKM Ac-2803]